MGINIHATLRCSIKTMFFTFLKSVLLGFCCALFCVGNGFAQSEAAPDEENCLICHRYPSLGRYDEAGNKRVYYINDHLFATSVHGRLRCKSCHTDLNKIPHEDVKKIDCSTQCHIKDPSSNREFSHKGMVNLYDKSVHGQGVLDKKRFPEDRPTCTYCHGNRLFNAYAGFWGKSEELSRETLARCQGCHTDKKWTEQIYAHFTHRMRRRRSQNEIIQLCTSCHEDKEKMERHGLEAVSTFKDTFHWTLVKYDVQNAPDCITCHVPVGYSTHTIKPRSDPGSPLYKNNRIKTCSNQGGVQNCHPNAIAKFAEGRVHAYGTKVQLMAAEERAKAKQQEVEPLILIRAREEVSHKEVFHYKVLSLIKLFYQILIAAVIGFMLVHQLLDYRRTRKKIKIEKKKGSKHRDENASELGDSTDAIKGSTGRRYFIRLTVNEKRQHFILVVCFVILALTGIMVWLPEEMFHFLGNARTPVFIARGVIHRIFGVFMILVSMYHAFYLIAKQAGRRWLVSMIPKPKDIKDFFHNILYFIEIKNHPPEFDRFSYKHKAEYGALIVGTTLMSVTGLILWAESFWDKFVIDIATLIHGMEAVLACLAVMIWHLYEVHLRPHKFPIDNMWLTGLIDEAEMKEEHALHYQKIMNDPELQKLFVKEG